MTVPFLGTKTISSCLRWPEVAVVKSYLCSLKREQVVGNVACSEVMMAASS